MFHKYIKTLACKQAQEFTLIDYLSLQDNVTIDDDDIYLYLNILQRPRLKSFLYFDNRYAISTFKKTLG